MEKIRKFSFICSVAIVALFSLIALGLILIAHYLVSNLPLKHILIVLGFAFVILAGLLCIYLDKQSGIFICPECGEEFSPDLKTFIKSLHTFKKRKLECPKCHKTTWCLIKKKEAKKDAK